MQGSCAAPGLLVRRAHPAYSFCSCIYQVHNDSDEEACQQQLGICRGHPAPPEELVLRVTIVYAGEQ